MISRVKVDLKDRSKATLEKGLFTFRKIVENTRILEEFKEHQFYLKPSLARRQRRLKCKTLKT